MTFQRTITANERLYMACESLCPPMVVNMVIEGRGTLDLAALQRAVEAASVACPGARLVAKSGRWVDTGRTPPVRSAKVESVLRERMDHEKGPTCEVVVEGESLVFRAFHGVMDGKGTLLWMEDVFRALRGESPLGAPSEKTDQVLVEELGAGKARKFGFDCTPPFPGMEASSYDYFFTRRTVSGSYPALVARVASVLCEQRSLRFMIPVDIRHHAPEPANTGNLSMPIFLDAQQGEPWEELQERILTLIAERAELTRNDIAGLLPGFGLKAMVRMAASVQRAKGKSLLCSAILSNVGRVDLRRFSTPDFQATTLYTTPAFSPLTPLAIAAVDLGSHVELTVSCAEGPEMHDELEDLLDAVEDALMEDG